MSLVAFCNTLLGLGFGPTAVASVTEFGFGRPEAVGYANAIVVAPVALASLGLFLIARRTLGSQERRNRENFRFSYGIAPWSTYGEYSAI